MADLRARIIVTLGLAISIPWIFDVAFERFKHVSPAALMFLPRRFAEMANVLKYQGRTFFGLVEHDGDGLFCIFIAHWRVPVQSVGYPLVRLDFGVGSGKRPSLSLGSECRNGELP